MKVETNLIILATAAILLFGITSALLIAHRPSTPVAQSFSGSWACAADYLQCPNGSSVTRVPPYCLFTACSSGAPAVATN